MNILCLDRNRPLRPRTCKEEEEEILMAVNISVLVFWVVIPWGLVGEYQQG
jgi:hypothetical protein